MLTMFFLINSFWVNFYIGTFDSQLSDGSDLTEAQAHNFARLFTLIITLGVVGIPLVGACMDHLGFPVTSSVLIVIGFVWALLLVDNASTSLVLSFVCYSAFRTFFFTFVFAYLADTLGFKYFGVLAGIMFVLGGVLSVLQYPLAQVAAASCVPDPMTSVMSCSSGYWRNVNIFMAVTILSTLSFSYQDWARRKQSALRRSKSGASGAELTALLPPRRITGDAYGTA
jgi:hypothetical protein